jgi:hypothetical protein
MPGILGTNTLFIPNIPAFLYMFVFWSVFGIFCRTRSYFFFTTSVTAVWATCADG